MKSAKMEKLTKTPFFVPLVLLVVCVLAYGLLAPTLGLYWDDWPYALSYHRFGPAGYPAFVASDRPYSAWIFMGLTWLLGENPLGYHITGIVLYWLCAVLFWKLFRLVWPTRHNEALWAGLLFAVYPGFLGQPKTIIYNHHFITMALYLFSLVGNVNAVKHSKGWPWHIPAVLAMVISQFSIEYYLGWEIIRPTLVWIVLSAQAGSDLVNRIRAVLKHLWPYWLGTMAFIVWRFFIFKFPTYQPVVSDEGVNINLRWLVHILSQIFDAVVLAWGRSLPFLSAQDYSEPFWLAFLVLTIFSAGLVFFLLIYYHRNNEDRFDNRTDLGDRFAFSALITALLGIFAAGWPFWLVDLELSITSRFRSRFTLAFIPWAVLLFVVILHAVFSHKRIWLKQVVLAFTALVVGGSVGWHFWNANYYRNDWIEVQRYFQQLVTRAPGIKPGTTLVVNDMRSITLYQDDSLASILNWTYDPENRTTDLDYMMFYLSVRLGNDLSALKPGLPIEKPFRSMHFSGSTDQILVVHYDPPGCLRVIDGSRPDFVPLTLPDKLVPAVPLSDISLINTDPVFPAAPPAAFFDLSEPTSWCLYYQAAELAAQRGDWGQVAEIGVIAYTRDDLPNELTEHFVFIEGYLRTGRFEDALVLSQPLFETGDMGINNLLCTLWGEAAQESDDSGFNLDDVLTQFCEPS